MVKADVKRDYYADLELPPTADAEDIKKSFRHLAKLYHPDRNPGKEVEFVAKFQAVQAAHEILSDSQQKLKYDTDRAKQSRSNNTGSSNESDPYNFRRPSNKSAPQTNPFPPPPRRPANSTQNSFFTSNGGRGKPDGASSGAERFNAFTRAPPKWDRAKFDEATARADAARGFESMRSSANATPQQQQQQQQQPPQQPPRPPRHPTAARGFGNARYDMPPPQNGSQQPFPGLSRTSSGRRQGFAPNTSGPDEAMASRTSAYARVQRDRPQSTYSQQQYPDTPSSPQMSKHNPTNTPLRHVRSSFESSPGPSRPSYERTPSQYATSGGERINIRTRVGRSSSVRTSPVDRSWDTHQKQDDMNQEHAHHEPPPARHHSASPKMKPAEMRDFSSSESSSDEDTSGPDFAARPKAQPRKPRAFPNVGPPLRAHTFSSDNDSALTGHFPNTNYTKVLDDDNQPSSRYDYPPPPSRDGFVRKPFASMPNPEANGDSEVRLNGENTGSKHPGIPRYEPFDLSREWSKSWGFNSPENLERGPTLNGLPSWAVPSSVFPRKPASNPLKSHELRSVPRFFQRSKKANFNAKSSSTHAQQNAGSFQGERQNPIHLDPPIEKQEIPSKFSPDKWEGHEYFRPNEYQSQDRKSPSRAPRTRARSVGKGSAAPYPPTSTGAAVNGNSTVDSTFKPGNLSGPSQFTATSPKKTTAPTSEIPSHASASPDAMDLDDSLSDTVPSSPPNNSIPRANTSAPHRAPPTSAPAKDGVDLGSLGQTAPFAPSNTGIHSLSDLSTNLPFESRPSATVPLGQSKSTAPSGTRNLDLPRPPKPIDPPSLVDLTQETWERYIRAMNAYLHDWNVFNIKMLDHFRTRQDHVSVGMTNHWMSSIGDGPTADEVDMSEHDDGVEARHCIRAGYRAYIAWLEDDAKCRTWWEYACEGHRKCFEDLGRVRTAVKSMAGVV